MGESRWKQRGQKKKMKKDDAAAAMALALAEKASKAVDDENCRVFHTTGGATYMSMDVAGGGLCALLAIFALA